MGEKWDRFVYGTYFMPREHEQAWQRALQKQETKEWGVDGMGTQEQTPQQQRTPQRDRQR